MGVLLPSLCSTMRDSSIHRSCRHYYYYYYYYLLSPQSSQENGRSRTENGSSGVTDIEQLHALLPLLEGPVIELSPQARSELEELQMEGDLLEVSLDQGQSIWRVLQAAQRPPLDTLTTIIEAQRLESRSGGRVRAKESDKRRKRKCDRGGGGGEGLLPVSGDGFENKKTRAGTAEPRHSSNGVGIL
ncbi:lysine-specific demethylase 5C-like [Acipenser ruthenus]|uniref:lysine-specific demethylase 5C-like n=1 Tax=Acipenser ruthenus TaxID=7906 RepID=UPI0027425C69|nr:lysine-specific demethylase 5C-like [Acipenser ruthenus]